MKKWNIKTATAIVLTLLAAAVVYAQVSVAGQTFYYNYVETVNPDTGARSQSNKKGKGAYITFTEDSAMNLMIKE